MLGICSKTLFVLTLSTAALGGVSGSIERASVLPQRLRPPALLQCSRDHLTSFQGRILEYKHGKQDISIRVRTDEDTTESFTLKWEASTKAETWFLLRGEGFKSDDWKEIESSAGKLREGMRIIVWVCDDGSKPVFDWRPKES